MEEVRLRVFTSIKRGRFGILNTHDIINSAYVGSISLAAKSIILINPELETQMTWL
jgi:hypothetical protein